MLRTPTARARFSAIALIVRCGHCLPTSMLRLPYIVNVIILAPVVLALMRGSMEAFPGAPESPVLRVLVASLWLGILLASAVALIQPASFWPLLLFQVLYKTSFLIVWVWPGMLRPEAAAIPWGPVSIFAGIVLIWPIFITLSLNRP